MSYNTESELFTIVGKYINGKLEYSYPRYMMVFGRVDFFPMFPMVNQPLNVERYDIFNPSEIPLSKNATYLARIIHFDDGNIAEIIKKIEPNGFTQ